MGQSVCSQGNHSTTEAEDLEPKWGPRTREDAAKEEVQPALPASAAGEPAPDVGAGGPVAPPNTGESGRLAVTIRSTQPDKVSPNYKRCTRSARPLTSDESMACLLGNMRSRTRNDPDGALLNAYTQEKPKAVYKDINKALRTDEDLDKHGGFIFLLKQALKNKGKEVGWYKGQVRRDMYVDAKTLAEFQALAARPGSEFLWAGFVSTTTVPPGTTATNTFRGNIRFEINLNEDANVPVWDQTRAVNIRKWSDYPDEDEILLMPYSALRVVKGNTEIIGEGAEARRVFVLNLESCSRESLDASAAKSVVERRKNQVNAQNNRGASSRSFELSPLMTLPVIAGHVVPGHAEGTALLEEPSKDSCYKNDSYAPDGQRVEILDVRPTGYALVRTAGGAEGWMSMLHLHVQLSGESFEGDLPHNAFVLSPGLEVVHGNMIPQGDGSKLRNRPSEDLGEGNDADITIRDGESVIVKEVSGAGRHHGYDFALISRAGGRMYDWRTATLGWIMTRNLHVQVA